MDVIHWMRIFPLLLITIICTTDSAQGSDNIPPIHGVSTQLECGSEFRCLNGQCIHSEYVCDGAITCADKSDETEAVCAKFACPGYLFKCRYGACVRGTAKCDGINDCADGSDEIGCSGEDITVETTQTSPILLNNSGCVLPDHFEGGSYVLINSEAYGVNSRVSSSTIIELKCYKGYTNTALKYFVCLGNQWLPSVTENTCIRSCRSLESTDTMDISCFKQGMPISCENPPEGTRAVIHCKRFYIKTDLKQVMYCSGGNWDDVLIPCTPVCGQKRINVQSLLITNNTIQKGEYPWVVTIYKTNNASSNEQTQWCSGSIITRKYVLTAAHCLTNTEAMPFDKDLFTVTAGKYYREFDHLEHNEVQIRKIKRIIVHEDYKGHLQKFRDDIALLEVDRMFELTSAVQPVCIDWTNMYEDLELQDNQMGVVVDWAHTQKGSSDAVVMKKRLVPIRSVESCRQLVDETFFHQYYTSDKICAGKKDEESNVCSGDGGMGLYLLNKHSKAFYIKGIASLFPHNRSNCNSNVLLFYTQVSKHLQWLKGIIRNDLLPTHF